MGVTLKDVTEIVVDWITREDESYFRYSTEDNPIIKNNKSNSIRFTLEDNYEDSDFQVIIRKADGKFFFKSDCYEDASIEYELTKFDASEETILFIEDEGEIIYFHLRKR